MVRGKTLFICTECKKVFMAPDVEYGAMVAPDVEYGAMVYSVPMPCKRCGSRRTLPIFQLLAYPVYKDIWETMEREKNDKNDNNENR